MGDRSAISWTNATWNPVTGCSHVSEGCRHCYAETLSLRMGWSKKPWTHQNAAENVVLHPERLRQPYSWREPRMVFVNSMSDLFHERISDDFIDDVFAVMSASPQHRFQVLTKRPERMLAYMTSTSNGAKRQMHVQSSLNRIKPGKTGLHVRGWPLPNVWLGVSVEDQPRADERIPVLLETPAAVRFLSVEPMLERVRFPLPSQGSVFWGGIDWIIVGGESGPHHRPMDLAWVREIKAQCDAAGVAYFFKQRAGPRPGMTDGVPQELLVQEWPA